MRPSSRTAGISDLALLNCAASPHTPLGRGVEVGTGVAVSVEAAVGEGGTDVGDGSTMPVGVESAVSVAPGEPPQADNKTAERVRIRNERFATLFL